MPAAIIPGDSAGSELIQRIQHSSSRHLMPPPDSKLSLTAGEIALLTRWIDEGAEYTEHWSFTAPKRHAPDPSSAGLEWAKDPLDRFIYAGLEAKGLGPSSPTDPATLLRRVHLDLTGLPPTAADLAAFQADEHPERYERVVDRLLTSDRHAEHLTARWMDVARYADTFGYQSGPGATGSSGHSPTTCPTISSSPSSWQAIFCRTRISPRAWRRRSTACIGKRTRAAASRRSTGWNRSATASRPCQGRFSD